MPGIAIGKLADIAATKVQTIRYFEEIGILQPFARSEGGHRFHEAEDAKPLKFIRHACELGFGIEELRELLQLSDTPETSGDTADAIARFHLEQIDLRLKKLQALRIELKRMVEECGRDHVSQC